MFRRECVRGHDSERAEADGEVGGGGVSQSGQDKAVLPGSRVWARGECGAVRRKHPADASDREDQAVPVISAHHQQPQSDNLSNDHLLRCKFSGKPLSERDGYLIWVKIPVCCSHKIIFQSINFMFLKKSK